MSDKRASDAERDVAFVLDAFQSFDVREGALGEYYERFWQPDGVATIACYGVAAVFFLFTSDFRALGKQTIH